MDNPKYYFEIFVYTNYEGSGSYGASLSLDKVMSQATKENDDFKFEWNDGLEINKVWFDSDKVETVCKIEIKIQKEVLPC